jgi:hypothetical protein
MSQRVRPPSQGDEFARSIPALSNDGRIPSVHHSVLTTLLGASVVTLQLRLT